MKKTLRTLIITTLLATSFTGCAKDNITVGDVVASPLYAVVAVGYVATKVTTIAVGGAVATTGAAVNAVSNSNDNSNVTIVANKD